MQSARLVAIALGLCLVNSSQVAYGQRTRAEMDRIAPGETITLPADVGTNEETLGLGFDQTLNPRDAAGEVHRIYPPVVQSAEEARFEINVDVIENQTELGAQARLLFLKAGTRTIETKRYVILRVASIKRVATLRESGAPQSEAAFLAQRILYGWAVYHIIEGDATTFTESIAASFKQLGIGFDKLVKKHALHVRKVYLGLTPSVEDSPDAVLDDQTLIEQHFHVNPKPVPIAVEYRALQDIYARRISWATNKLRPGQYYLSRVKAKVMTTKSDGRPWDNLSPPDPLVQVYLDDQLIHTCRHQDTFEAECEVKKLITLKRDSAIQVKVKDLDAWEEDDPVGTGASPDLLKNGVAFDDIELQTTDQLERATIQLIPVPGGADESAPSKQPPERFEKVADQPAPVQAPVVPPILSERPKDLLLPSGPPNANIPEVYNPTVVTQQVALTSGLRYIDLRPGTGVYPRMGQYVWIHYVARFSDGRIYDSTIGRNQPLGFWLGSPQVLRGLQEGLSTMRVGGRRRLIVPPHLSYGATPSGVRTSHNQFQTIDVDLVNVAN